MKIKKLYYELKQIGNTYYVNDLKVDYTTFDKVFYNTEKYKQISYDCYFDNKQNFVKHWILQENK